MNWELIALIAVVVLGSLSAWAGFKKLINEVKDLMVVVADAIEDDQIDSIELAKILKEVGDIGKAYLEIAKLFNRR